MMRAGDDIIDIFFSLQGIFQKYVSKGFFFFKVEPLESYLLISVMLSLHKSNLPGICRAVIRPVLLLAYLYH